MNLDSDGVRFYFVWVPVLSTDTLSAAQELASSEMDPRASHFWDVKKDLVRNYATPLRAQEGLGKDAGNPPIAWDVVLLFPRGVRWGTELPTPAEVHFPRDVGRDFAAFDSAELRQEVATALAPCTARSDSRQAAKRVVDSYCSSCHTAGNPEAKPKALAVFDLAEAEWTTRMSVHLLRESVMRLAGVRGPTRDRPAKPDEVSLVCSFVEAEIARRKPIQ
jgi:hypothetical protein